MTDRHAEFWAGVDACMVGDPCPEGASEAFQRGYGMQFAAEQAQPPIDLKEIEEIERMVG
jgi:hypothetical protein